MCPGLVRTINLIQTEQGSTKTNCLRILHQDLLFLHLFAIYL